MKRREFKILLLVFSSIIVSQLHLLLSNMPVNKVDLIKYLEVSQDLQWYIYDTGDYLSSLFIFIVLRMVLPYKLKVLGTFLIIGSILDIANYWLFFHQFDWTYKYIIIVIPTLLIIFKHEKGNNNRPSR